MTTLPHYKSTALPHVVQQILLPLVIAAVACCWMLPGLGNGMLWQDEAQTALLGRTTLRYGVPIGLDGANSISQENGDDYGPRGLWKWHMWLPFYVLAGFFKLFGEGTAVARLPFALMGVGTVVLAYFTAQLLWRDWKAGLVTSLLILACIPFVILARQCRYYSFTMFFSLLVLDAYLRICRGSRRAWIELCLAGVLLFNSHFLYCATAWGAIALHAIIWHRNRWRPLLLASIVSGLLCLPPVLWLASLNYRNYSHDVFHWRFAGFQLRTYLHLEFRWIVPYPIVLMLLIVEIGERLRRHRLLPTRGDLEPWAWPVFFSILTIVGCAPFTPWPFFRYIGPIIAPLMILLSQLVLLAFRRHAILGSAAILLLCFCWPIRAHLYEMRHPYTGPTEGIVALLRDKGRPGDVLVTPYEDLALKFYTPYRIVGGLTGEDLSAGTHARWLVVRRKTASPREPRVADFIAKQLSDYQDYQPVVLNVPDIPFENREEPLLHRFADAKGFEHLVVYERTTPVPAK